MLVDQIERRQDSRTRKEAEIKITYQVSGDEEQLQGWLIEWGEGGARLRLDYPHTPNTDLIISGLPAPLKKPATCRVRWVRKASINDEGYEIGISCP